MKVLIDGDIIVYRCGFAAESTRYTLVVEGNVVGQFDSAAEYKEYAAKEQLEDYVVERERLYEPLSHALANVKTVMSNLMEELNPEEVYIFLSEGECFRSSIATIKKYKGNRDDTPRPKWYKEIREYLVDNYNAYVYSSVEADDVLALCQNEDTCIVSIDKDLLQVPGKHYNWVQKKKIMITPEVGTRKLFLQVLTGDSTDNIPGIRGVGPVRAKKLLEDIETDPTALAEVCVAEWDKYLKTERAFDDGFMYHVDGMRDLVKVEYVPWNSDTYHESSPQEIAAEVYQLVKVGGQQAYEILQETGEALPFPPSKAWEEAEASQPVPFVAGGGRSAGSKEEEG